MSNYQTVRSAAAQLSVEDRLRLIDDLASSVPDDQPPSLSAEWLEEVERRAIEIDCGAVVVESWEEIRRRLRQKVDLNGKN